MKLEIKLIAIALLTMSNCLAQKPEIDSSILERNKLIFATDNGDIQISNDGKYVSYSLRDPACPSWNTLIVQSVAGDWKRNFAGKEVKGALMSKDSKELLFTSGHDSLCLLSLGTDQQQYIPEINSYQLINTDFCQWLVCHQMSSRLLLYNMSNKQKTVLSGVSGFQMDKSGSNIILYGEEGWDSIRQRSLKWIDLKNNKETVFWKGTSDIVSYAFDNSGKQVVFAVSENQGGKENMTIWSYRIGECEPVTEVDNNTEGLDSGLEIAGNRLLQFSADGSRIFFMLLEKPGVIPKGAIVDIWHYQDISLQDKQLEDVRNEHSYAAVLHLGQHRIIRLQQEHEQMIWCHKGKDNYAIVYPYLSDEGWWNLAARCAAYKLSTVDGSRKLLINSSAYPLGEGLFKFSNTGQWILYFNREMLSWWSFNTITGKSCNISKNIPYPVVDEGTTRYPTHKFVNAAGIAGWLEQEKKVLIYDDYDIWEVDPTGQQKPVTITQGYGRAHHIKFRIPEHDDEADHNFSRKDILFLNAFHTQTKFNGFFRTDLSKKSNPEQLSMGPYVVWVETSQTDYNSSMPNRRLMRKAKDANVWVMSRRSATEAFNYFITKDLKTFVPLTNIQPQQKYNWLTTELINWKLPNGQYSQGILYKPENFDPARKYPVIFYYYEQMSDNVYDYPMPGYCIGQLNVPYFVSRGYLIFCPDIHYRIGHPGQSAMETVESAAKYLSLQPWVDSKHMGIQGHSFGGFETNYIVTHSHLFAAAAEGAGPSDFISGYGRIEGITGQYHYETAQSRIGANLWDGQQLFIENSPILKADQVTTPLLMMHNKWDGSVAFGQGIELFTALRRLGKRVWLLQYDNGGHGVGGKGGGLDYTIRMTQFFDHYLKGTPPPKWMTEGIPAKRKGLDTGYELDSPDKEPQEQPVLFKGKIQKVSEAIKNKIK